MAKKKATRKRATRKRKPDPKAFEKAMNKLADAHGFHWGFGPFRPIGERMKEMEPELKEYGRQVKRAREIACLAYSPGKPSTLAWRPPE